jgi:isocitrate lyase
MFELARSFNQMGMLAYAELQEREFEAAENYGYAAVKHQRFVGTGYFDLVATTIASGNLSTCATPGSTEQEQFEDPYGHEVPDTQPARA